MKLKLLPFFLILTLFHSFLSHAQCDGSFLETILFECDEPFDMDNRTTFDAVSGTWSGGAFITSDGVFTPAGLAAGDYTITFTTSSPPCAPSTDFIVTIAATPEVFLTQNTLEVCENDGLINLSIYEDASSTSGFWEGTGLTNINTFDPTGLSGEVEVTFVAYCDDNEPASCTPPIIPNPVCGCDGVFYNSSCAANLAGVNTYTPWIPNFPFTCQPGGGCEPDEEILTITVLPSTEAVLTNTNVTLCDTDIPVSLNDYVASSSDAGTWNVPVVFDPMLSGVGNYFFDFSTGTDNCDDTATLTITVEEGSDIILTQASLSLCSDAGVVNLNDYFAASSDIGTWSGDGVDSATGFFDTNAAGLGVQTLTVGTGFDTCDDLETFVVVVNEKTTALLIDNSVMVCSGDGPIDLNQYVDPASSAGNWSGTGVNNNLFNPAAGSQALTFSTIPAGACDDDATLNILVIPTPDAILNTTIANVCFSDGIIDLTQYESGSSDDGIWAGSGVTSINSEFDVNAGSQTLTFTSVSGDCQDTETLEIVVNPSPVINLIQAFLSICGDSGPIDLSTFLGEGTDSGDWSGTGVSGTLFDPNAGTQNLTYTTNFGECDVSETLLIAVNPNAIINLTQNSFSLCSTDAAIDLTTFLGAGTDNGTWLGTGVSGTLFDPSAGSQTLTYTTNLGDCDESATLDITVNPPATINFTQPSINLCSDAEPIDLSAFLGAGTVSGEWSGTGVSGTLFNPIAGNQTLTYTTNLGECDASENFEVTVNPTAVINLTQTSFSLCSTDAAIDLTTFLGAGTDSGEWLGTGVSGNTFDPSVGSQLLTYTTNLGDCDVSDELNIEVTNPSDASTISPANGQLCSNSGEDFVQTLDLTTLISGETGGTWTYSPEIAGFNPISGSTFNANGLPIDTYTLIYTIDGGEPCGEISSSQSIEVVECLPDCTADASFNLPPDLCGIAGNVLDLNTLVTGDSGGIWTTSAPIGTLTGSSFNPEDLSGDFTITYTVADEIADCPDAIQNASINIIAPPNTATTIAPTQNFCDTEVGFDLSSLVVSPANGTWSSADAPSAIDGTGFFSFEGIAAGQYVVVYTIAAQAPCTEDATSSEIITIQDNDNTAGEDAEVCGLTTSLNAISSEEGFWAISLAPSPTATVDFADENDPQTAVTVSEGGVYSFFWSHIDPFANVCFDEDVVDITFSESMQVSTESVCSADNLTYDFTATISGGYPPYIVDGTQITGNTYSLTLNDEEAYSFVVDDSGNCDEIEVNGSFSCFCPPPTDPVIVADNLSYCEGETIPTFSVIDNGVDTFHWYQTETSNAPIASGIDFTPSIAGTYWVEALSPEDCISANRLPVTLQEIPTPNPPQVIPLSAIVLQNQFFIAEATPSEGGEINWYNELGELVFTGLEYELPTAITGDFTLFVTETVNGCESEPTEFNYTVNPFDLEDCPNITSFNVPNPHHVCSGEEVTISFENDDEANYVRGEWVDFDGNVLSSGKSLTISETIAGCNAQAFQYIARTYCVINPNEVFDADTLTVIFYPFPESATIEEVGEEGCSIRILPQPTCPNFSIYTEAGELVENSFDFPFGEGTVNFVLANEEALAVGLSDCAEPVSYNYNCIQVGCPTIDPPIALSQTEVSFCESEEIVFNFEVDAPLEGVVNWYDVEAGGEPILENSLSFTAISEGIYYAEIMTFPDDCRSTRIPFRLTVSPLDDSSFSYPSSVFCLNEDNPFPNFVATTGGTFGSPDNIDLNGETGEILLSELSAGTEYTIEYQTNGDCPTTTSFTFNIVEDGLQIDAGETINICRNEPILLNGETLLGTPNSLQWSANIEGDFDNPLDLQTAFQPTDTTSNFYLYLTATNTCEELVVDSVQVFIEESGELSIEGNTTLNLGETTQLEVMGGNGVFQWTTDSDLSCTDCFNPIFTATTAGTTTLVVESGVDCIPPLMVNITVIAPETVPILTFPNAFSPNEDGINDEFRAVSNERLESYSLQIYNRWGEQVFESTDINEAWDGSYKDRMGEIGVYVYVLQYQFVGGDAELKQGNVTLVF